MNPAHGSSAISLRNVAKRFAGSGAPAVEDLSIEIAVGDVVALVGPSGCGKTTTLKMINRLVEPSGGTIEVLGQDQATVPAHELRRSIGYVIQQIGLFPHRTIRRNIGTVPELLRWDKRRIADRVAELVGLVGLDESILDRYPADLSGGQQQRVGVARALAADPPILLMDEPYSAVDPIVRSRLQDELLALQAAVRKTVVIVTHDVDEAIRLADRVAILNVGGVLEQFAAPDELLSAPASDFVASFLGRERGLRRLALRTVADVETIDGPVVAPTATAADARAVFAEHHSVWAAVVEADHLHGWVALSDLETVPPEALVREAHLQPFVARVTPRTQLREALDVILTSRSRVAAVIGDGDRFAGMITIDEVAGGLT